MKPYSSYDNRPFNNRIPIAVRIGPEELANFKKPFVMKYVWPVIAVFAVAILAIIMVFQNSWKLVYNLFHKHKKIIRWHPLDDIGEPTEDFYHH